MFIAAVIWGRGDNNLTSVSGATFSGTEENNRTERQLVERSLLMLAEILWPPPAGLLSESSLSTVGGSQLFSAKIFINTEFGKSSSIQ